MCMDTLKIGFCLVTALIQWLLKSKKKSCLRYLLLGQISKAVFPGEVTGHEMFLIVVALQLRGSGTGGLVLGVSGFPEVELLGGSGVDRVVDLVVVLLEGAGVVVVVEVVVVGGRVKYLGVVRSCATSDTIK